jgi:hypothetical protein
VTFPHGQLNLLTTVQHLTFSSFASVIHPHAKKEQLVQRRSRDAAQTQTKSGVVMLRKIDCKVDVVELAAGDDTRQRLPEV